MKKTTKRIICIVVVFVIAFTTFSYFHVAGNEIDGVSEISSETLFTITKGYHLSQRSEQYVLDAKQNC